jgi:UDP-hydrolysing UDP-N-acetyl-D-glucosamine 2-epimerase
VRTIGVVTVGRSDYGIYTPILKRIQDDPELTLSLFVGGMHLRPEHGRTIEMIQADGYPITAQVEMLSGSDSPLAVAQSIGRGVIGFAEALSRSTPDILVVLGDRFEMYSAAVATLPFNIPVAHIHGGELTLGAIDDALRHSMTKLSHLHFVSTEAYAKRVIQLGEEPWRVTVSGAPGLDNLDAINYLERADLERMLDIDLGKTTLLVTFHPVTLEYQQIETQIDALLSALEKSGCNLLFTSPNADTGGGMIAERIRAYVNSHSNSRLAVNLGTDIYFSLMKHVAAMVGNSSSGIIEAPSFNLPVVNIGSRQDGRVRGINVIDVPGDCDSILSGIQKALSRDFKTSLFGSSNPYKRSNSAIVIAEKLKNMEIDRKLLMKNFHDRE